MSFALPQSPETQILERMKRIAIDAHLGKTLGLDKEFTVRHRRHRDAIYTERPALSIALVAVDVNEEEQAYHTPNENCWRAEIDLIVDMDLPAEDEDARDTSGAQDLTGWDHLTTAARMFANLYLDTDGEMFTVVDDVRPGKIDPDEDSKPDQGRLAMSVIVLYRTSARDTMRLLNAEMNA